MSLLMRGVTLTYPDGASRLRALDAVDFTVNGGEFSAVVGRSGSGKSSLLAVAGTLLTPDEGGVTVAGTPVHELDDACRTRLRRDRIGIVFQQSNLIAALTAAEQLELAGHLRGHPRRDRARRARELLAAVGLDEAQQSRRPHQLSGGERQRVNIARALVAEPALLLVDEPTAALDEERSAQIVALLGALTRDRGLATVMVTHDLAHLAAVDRVHRMADGRLSEVEQSTVA
ncbi:ABC transporter ATP-binding protein [Lentzea aerocolonigenes]|uniref:ABC transporter ATP-binding protein n=1 Tax=Lentzea aerocolonigenes TaxID=68170 RepID=A0A0F0H4J2_LENAE|nr:ABC transporter ATP-binding protein [Lentzea aerocolonigenes]KJK49237.1 ABC transporter ATP-binding protein [Lentzea aerocolonigenes]